ncbi:hypothetical protein IM543_15515 [Massilia sp. UMI-21]|nr:hypothetical protein IM543_15515 [Massilia sp. UMI-21]
MNPLRTALNKPDGAAGADSRRDLRQRDIVDDGIALMRTAGTLSALEYLKSRSVEGRIIARVLLDPARRRGLAAA